LSTSILESLDYKKGYDSFIFLFQHRLLLLLGATSETYDYSVQFIFWTTTIGVIPTVLNPLLAHQVRAEDAARQAGFGMILGCLLNIELDPILMFPLNIGLAGFFIALTAVISNITLTRLLTAYSTKAIAGMGIAKKIDLIAYNFLRIISLVCPFTLHASVADI